jgi:uncharacterized repeat protein (TIGR03803 family)
MLGIVSQRISSKAIQPFEQREAPARRGSDRGRNPMRLVVACSFFILAACGDSDIARAPSEAVLHSFGAGTDGANPSARLIQARDGAFYGTTVNGGDAGSGTVFKLTPPGGAQTFYSFTAGSSGGAHPEEALVQASNGDFYGTTRNGGSDDKGIVFKITAAGAKTVLHFFGSGDDGANPIAGVIQASDGDFYGTTYYGGAFGEGTVFKVSAAGDYSVLYSFTGGADGANPAAGLIQGSDGHLYGTTYYGGGATDQGTVFRLALTGEETVLHAFGAGADGAYADVGMVEGSDGKFYGVTASGGAGNVGTVFAITPAGDETILYSFAGGEDGSNPNDGATPSSRLIQANDGNFYGTTFIGGANEVGTIFRISPSGDYAVIYSFGGSETGAVYPDSALVQGTGGDFYGTTEYGGEYGLGTVYQISF